MGIALNAVYLLSRTLPLLGDLSNKKVLTLGVQDCYFGYDKLLKFLRRHGIRYAPISTSEIRTTTGFRWVPLPQRAKYRDCIHQTTFFKVLGFSESNIHAMDVSGYEGAGIIHDLNMPVSEAQASRYDLVFDGGTIEHVFSTKDAFFNVCRLCKVGGIAVNWAPTDMINHGFVNFNAEIFRDCFLANGFEEITLKYIAHPKHEGRADQFYLEFDPDRFSFSLQPYYEAGVYSVYRKIEERECLTVPLQGYYRKLFATGQAPGVWRNNRVRDVLREWVDSHFLPSVLIRGFVQRYRGRKVVL